MENKEVLDILYARIHDVDSDLSHLQEKITQPNEDSENGRLFYEKLISQKSLLIEIRRKLNYDLEKIIELV